MKVEGWRAAAALVFASAGNSALARGCIVPVFAKLRASRAGRGRPSKSRSESPILPLAATATSRIGGRRASCATRRAKTTILGRHRGTLICFLDILAARGGSEQVDFLRLPHLRSANACGPGQWRPCLQPRVAKVGFAALGEKSGGSTRASLTFSESRARGKLRARVFGKILADARVARPCCLRRTIFELQHIPGAGAAQGGDRASIAKWAHSQGRHPMERPVIEDSAATRTCFDRSLLRRRSRAERRGRGCAFGAGDKGWRRGPSIA